MQICSNLYLLSTIACQLADCLSDDDLAILAADLVVLSDMLANIAARNAVCEKNKFTGFREYWIVDPEKQRTTIYCYEEDVAPMILPFQQDITVGIYSDLNINIAELLK